MTTKNVSILVYVHNNIDTIEVCINSIIMGLNDVNNLIVIDDGSSDESITALKNFNQIKIVQHEFKGISKSINEQLNFIGDNDLIRLDGNVVIATDNWLEQLQNTAYNDKETGIVGVRLLYANNRIETDGRNFINGLGYENRFVNVNALKINGDCVRQIQEVDSVSSSFAYYKNCVLKKVGYFDENYFPFFIEDDDYCIAARKNNFSIVADSFIQAYHFIPVKTQLVVPVKNEDEKIICSLLDRFDFIYDEHFKYWEKKWLWNPKYPDLDLIRNIYRSTKITWNIDECLKYKCVDEYPSVDICLVTCNNLALLKRTIESLFKTDYPRDKITMYITDNGSNDGTIEYLKKLSEESVFKIYPEFLPINSGVVYALNLAIIKGKGNLVAKLDDDILLPFNWLKELVRIILKRPYCGMTAPKILNDVSVYSIQCVDSVVYPSHETCIVGDDTGQFDYLSKATNLRGCCNLYRREVFNNCGLFDIRYSPNQYDDLDHQLNVIAKGYELIYNGKVSIIHKIISGIEDTPSSLSSFRGNQLKLFGKWGIDIYEKLNKSIELSREGWKIDLEKNVSYNLNQNNHFNYTLDKNYCSASEKIIDFYFENRNELNKIILSFLEEAQNQIQKKAYFKSLSILNMTLGIFPSFIPVILMLYVVYYHLGLEKETNHYEGLLRKLNKKNVNGSDYLSEAWKEEYLKIIRDNLDLAGKQNHIEDIIKNIII